MKREQEIKQLKKRLALLEEERDLCLEQSEDILLLSDMAEKINRLSNVNAIINTILENICILKELDYASFLTLSKSRLEVTHEYIYGDLEPKLHQIVALSQCPDLNEISSSGVIVCESLRTTLNNSNILPSLPYDAQASTALLAMETNENRWGFVMICCLSKDLRSTEKYLPLLKRVIAIAAARIEKLNLINKINNLNKQLQKKYADVSRELQLSEHKYRTLFEKANDAIFLVDPEMGQIIDCNHKAAEMEGYDIKKLLTMKMTELHPPEEIPLLPPLISKVIRVGSGAINGLHHLRGNGRLVPVEINAASITIKDKKAILSIVRDITRQTITNEELKKAKNYAENIIEAANAMLIVTDKQGKTMVFNRTAEIISGYSRDEVIGKKITEFFPIDGAIAPFEMPITTKSGTKRLISWQNSQIKLGGEISGYIFFGIDTTEKKEAQNESLNYINELEILNNIISTISSSLDTDSVLKNTIKSAVNLIDGDAGSIALYDPENESMHYPYHYNMPEKFKLSIAKKGTGLAEEVMRSGKSIVLKDYPRHPRALPEFVKQGLKVIAAVPVATKDKSIGALGVFGFSWNKEFSRNDVRILEAVGKEAGVAIENSRLYKKLKELSAHLEQRVRERTKELKNANDKLLDLDRLKSMFIASTSHELRTPLNSIIGFSGILLEGWSGKLNAEQKENIHYVYQAGKHLLALINDIIDISKIESGKLDMKTEDFKLREVVDEALVSLKTEISEKSLNLTEDVEDIAMKTDRQRLFQCLVNLVSNAVKFTEAGGIELTAKSVNGDVNISVRDTGIGIKKSDMNHLFKPFTRLETPLRDRTSGTGLGLYLTKKLAKEALKGSVKVSSKYHRGSTFSLKIPVKRDVK